MIIEELSKRLVDYDIRKITGDDYEDLYNLQLTNPDYFSYMQEHEVTVEECIKGTKALPPNTSLNQKFYMGFYSEDKLEIIMDLIVDYPDKGIVWIGLLMVDAKLKRRGLGREVMLALIKLLLSNSFYSIQLGVIESNYSALSFWNSLNFNEIRRSNIVDNEESNIEVIVMEYIL